MKFRARTTDKRQLDVNWDRVNAYLSKWPPGTFLDIEIVRRQKRRSDPLRKYYFGAVLPPILEHAGYEKDEALELHRWFKIKYFQVQPHKKWGIHRDKDIPSVFSDESELIVGHKKDFVDYVIRKAAKAGIYIPDPKQ